MKRVESRDKVDMLHEIPRVSHKREVGLLLPTDRDLNQRLRGSDSRMTGCMPSTLSAEMTCQDELWMMRLLTFRTLHNGCLGNRYT